MPVPMLLLVLEKSTFLEILVVTYASSIVLPREAFTATRLLITTQIIPITKYTGMS